MTQRLSAKGILAISAVSVFLVVGVANLSLVRAQSPQSPQAASTDNQKTAGPALAFEVTSIKPDNEAVRMYTFGWYSPGTFSTIGATARDLIRNAYRVSDKQVLGAPKWTDSLRYDITAKMETDVTHELREGSLDQRGVKSAILLQSLLSDRFKLALHHETRELPIYALVVAKGGPKIQAADPDETKTYPNGDQAGVMRVGKGRVTLEAMPVATLAGILSGQPELADRNVTDETGLKGRYDLTLEWTPEVGARTGIQGAGNTPPSDSGTSLFSALQEQLGLRIESTKGPVDTIVIDHIEEPSPN